MPPDRAEVEAWLAKAQDGVRAARVLMEQAPPIAASAAFHCQQAVEKLLKAYLLWNERSFEKIHDLRALVNQCVEIDAAFAELRDRVAPLTAFAVRFRYPGPGEPSRDQVTDALRIADEVREFVSNHI